MIGDLARLVLTEHPYNAASAGHAHGEFPVASGEMSAADFGDFDAAWIGASLVHVRDAGRATFIG
jgi:hypothetical protein